MPVSGQELVVGNIKLFGGGFIDHVNKTMNQVRGILEAKVLENITLRDHSLQDLADMGHPYAKRHGEQGHPIHDPYYQVHEQSGELRSSEKSGTIGAEVSGGNLTATAYVGLDEAMAPHALHVVFGTSKMIPRPVLEGSRNEVLGECQDLIGRELKNLTTSFRGKS